MAEDRRASFVVSCVESLCGLKDASEIGSHDLVQQFLNDNECRGIQVCAYRSGKGSVEFSVSDQPQGTVKTGHVAVGQVHFSKNSLEELSEDNMRHCVVVTSVQQTPIESLYQSLHNVYAPELLNNPGSGLSKEVQSLLSKLDSRLGSAVRGGPESRGIRSPPSSNGTIISPLDEVVFWEEEAASGGRGAHKRRAEGFSKVLGKLRVPFETLGSMSLSELVDFCEDVEGVLDDLWRLDAHEPEERYPQERMEQLFRVIGTSIVGRCTKVLAKHDLWHVAFPRLRSDVEEAIRVCERWSSSIEELTGTHWVAFPEHAWQTTLTHTKSNNNNNEEEDDESKFDSEEQRKGFLDSSTGSFIRRLNDILRIRTTHEELRRLLSQEEQERVRVDELFQPFHGLPALYPTQYTQKTWDTALIGYEKSLQPVEKMIGKKLGKNVSTFLGNDSLNPQVLLNELLRYRNLVIRPQVKQALVSERESALARVTAYIDELDSEFEARSHDAADAAAQSRQGDELGDGVAKRSKWALAPSRNFSPTVSAIIWGRQLGACVEGILSAANQLFEDLSAFPRLSEAGQALVDRCDSYVADVFRDWCVDMEEQLADGELSLHLTGRLMKIDLNGLLQVNFSERLVSLLRETRQLGEMGLSVPSKVRAAAHEADKYYRYGVMLKKTATFFNSMGSQIITSQKGMLYDALVEFESEVHSVKDSQKKGKTITWGDPNECRAYTERLRAAADKLSAENRRLHQAHEWLGINAVKLLDVDILRQSERWKQQWGKVALIVGQLESSYDPKRMAKWKLHWDHQVYKCLESSYRMGLESLNEHLGEIKTEMVFSTASQRVQFRPPLEELRATYYRKMKRFVAIPAGFEGLSGGSVARESFGRMADRNAESLLQVYRKAEALFARLEALCESMEPYAVLGRVGDLDTLVEETCVQSVDWETNFRSLKTKRRELEKLQDFYKVDCISVSTTMLKVAVEEQLSRLSDALLLSLRKRTLGALKQVEGFVDASMERLGTRPESIEEISQATAEWGTISGSKAEWKRKWTSSEDGRKLLLTVAAAAASEASGGIDVSEVMAAHGRLPGKWEDFEVALVAFNDMIEDQREALKARVGDDVEACRQQVGQFVSRWDSLKPGKDGQIESWDVNAVSAIFEELDEWRTQFDEVRGLARTAVSNSEHFELEVPRFEQLEEVERDFEQTLAEWTQYRDFTSQLDALQQRDWISFRSSIFDAEDLAKAWLDGMKGKARGIVLDRIAKVCTALRKAIPALKFMRGEPFKEEHWSTLFRQLGMPKGTSLDKLTFGHFLDVLDAVGANLQFAKEMTARAQGEVTIREAITELKSWSETAALEMIDHEEMGRVTPLIKNWKDVLSELGDNQSLLASLKESQYFRPFEQQAAVYESNMAALDSYLGMMNQIQRKWLYLEPIFGRGALPSETARFKRIDEDWVDIMTKLGQESLLFTLCDEAVFPRLGATLGTIVDQLERCQKALADFLEDKRSKLPRFYFIGDDDLLEILGQAQNPTVIQSHLKKLFQGIHSVAFDESESAIVAVCSNAGERVDLEEPVAVTERVEEWLQTLSDEVARTLQAQLVRCVHEKKQVDLGGFPSQVLCLAENIKFTSRCEHAIKQDKVGALRKLLKKTLAGYTSADLSTQPLNQLKVKSLILDLVHNIDVCEQLERGGVTSLEDWHWDKQLRYYLNKSNLCVARMCDAEIDYTYEYWGNAPKLVHTPLTDKCYLTLTQGMHMGFGGSPYGPAGTGKTESVKALGSCLGRQVLVFNCDEGIDFHSMGRIFTGLVKCGAWGCFDEFNRLKEDQLSAVSQQIQVIQAAIKDRRPTLRLLGKTVDVDCNAGIFVTMNPAGKGYGGRSKLPDNLKQLFRPVAMSRPDNNLIAEVILYSEGFQNAKDLGQKLVSLYQLSKELLSPQQHYDWGLRAMKAVLNTGGKLVLQAKREAGSAATDVQHLDAGAEREILIKAIRVNTLSKLTYEDSRAFLGLIGDVFPGAESNDVRYPDLEAAIQQVLDESGGRLEHSEAQVRKMLQLKESLDQRMGCVIVGPSGCGKSTLWRVLKEALKRCGTTVKSYEMNPKAMPRERLLGYMDMDTREWFDGVLTDAARRVVKEPLETRSWIVCDGDVDPEWIESLNSVLDDNKLLTMPNGERISFGSNVNFIFETHDLRFASPATVSRMGMIFLSDEDVDVHRLVKCWLAANIGAERAEEGGGGDLPRWVEEYFYAALDWVLKRDAFVVDTTMVGTVLNGLSHVQRAESKAEFALGLVRGLGGNLSVELRKDLALFVYEQMDEMPPSSKAPLDCYAERGVLASYCGRTELEGEFSRLAQSGAIIQTASVQRNLSLIQPWVDSMKPFVLVGPEGCGKTMLLTHCFRQNRATSVTTLHCNAQTSAAHVIQKIQQACSLFSTNSGRVYRPRESERLVLYLKDINLPKPDKYGTCMLVAFLQQLITMQGFYDDNLEFLGLERVQIVCSMNPATTVGRHELSSRFTAVMRIAYIDYPEPEELDQVFASILEAALSRGPVEARWGNPSNLSKLAQTMVELFKSVKQKFSVDEHRHYLFTPRDLTRWVLGLLRYDLENEDLLDIFAYEGQRIFRDRLVDQDSKTRFDSLLSNLMRKDWSHNFANLSGAYFTALSSGSGSTAFGASAESKAGEAAAAEEEGGESSGRGPCFKLLQRIGAQDFSAVIEHGMNMYEREEKELNIKLFDEVLEHISYVDRVLSKPGGSMLLVGRSGVGRRTATTLVAHMHGMEFSSPCAVGGGDVAANMKAFHSTLKAAIQNAGVEGQHTVLYVEDHHVFDEEVLETLNSLLCSGEVPGLYKHEELVPLLDPLKEKMNEEVSDGSVRTPYEFFVRRVQTFLHVVVAMDPTHSQFLLRCESNPALYTGCSILWFGEWSRASLLDFPAILLPEYFGEEAPEDWDPEALQRAAIGIHDSCRASHGATPRELVAFLECFRHLHETKADAVEKKVAQFLGGLAKLEEASATVDELNADAGVQREELQQKQAQADASMEEITASLQQASRTRKETESLGEELKEKEAATLERKGRIEVELADIQPVLESAKEAVGGIKSDNLNELRSLKMPPDPVADVLSAVLMLLGVKDTSWLSMKKFLGNRGVKEEILNFDTHRITPEIRSEVMKLLRAKSNSFERATIQRVSIAAAPFAAWVKANIKYSLVLDKIQPLEADLDEASRDLAAAQERMKSCEEELLEIDERVQSFQDNFKKMTKEAAELNIRLQDTEATLEKAEKLLGELAGEKERWSGQAKDLRRVIKTLPMRILLSAAFCTYLGKSPESVREQAMACWARDLCVLAAPTSTTPSAESKAGEQDGDEGGEGFDVKRIMSSESEMLVWKSQQGLPGDALSMENAVIITNLTQQACPFVVDPANAATRWLKVHLASKPDVAHEVVAAQDPRFVNQVELAVRFGKLLVVTEVDGVDPMLYPLIRQDLKRQGPRWVVQVGEKLIDFNEKFRLILVTRNPEPCLAPDAASLVTEVNFTVTSSGLEGQLLGVTVKHEQPQLEDQKSEVLKQEEDFKVQLSALEKDLLDTLAASQGNLLENKALLETLSKTKEKSLEVSQALEQSAELSMRLDKERNQYRAFAKAGSALYFCLQALQKVNHMYQFSLESFVQLFQATLVQSTSSSLSDAEGNHKNRQADIAGLMDRLVLSLEQRVLHFCSRALFKADRLMFAVHLVKTARPQLFQEYEYEFFIGEAQGGEQQQQQQQQQQQELVEGKEEGSSRKRKVATGLLPPWAAPDREAHMRGLQETFPRLVSKLELGSQDWNRWGRHPECEKAFPSGLDNVTAFQRVLVTAALRPDRLESALTLFCADALGVESLAPPPSSIAALMEPPQGETAAPPVDQPILLIATPGADPTTELVEYASKTVGADNYLELAMGGGQTDDALVMLREAARSGQWLCLKNLHLVSAWIPRLEKAFNALGSKHASFRLWLTTEETAHFAPVLLQQSLKVTFEAPPGVKKNLQRTYNAWPEDLVESGGELHARLLFLLAWLHALMQERRTYIPQGWTKFYEFSLGDLRSGCGAVALAAETAEAQKGQVDWPYIHGLIENSVYGGRIDNPFDQRVLRAYLEQYFDREHLESDRLQDGLAMPPYVAEKSAFCEWIDANLDDADAPHLFGLPANVERSVQRARSNATVAALKALSAGAVDTAAFDRDEWCRKLQPVIALWHRLKQSEGTDQLLGKPSTTTAGEDSNSSPTQMFVALEEQRACAIVQKVTRAMSNLSAVVSGTGLLTPQIQADGAALMQRKIPADWEAMWEGPSCPMDWLRGLVRRTCALRQWARRAQKGSLFDHSFDLADLFHPGTFINALRQETARAQGCSMDALSLRSAWSREDLAGCERAIALKNLSIQGATLEGGRLREPAPDAPEVVAAPDCYLAFVPHQKHDQGSHNLPLYKSLDRETLLFELTVPVAKDPAKWVTASVAFFLR